MAVVQFCRPRYRRHWLKITLFTASLVGFIHFVRLFKSLPNETGTTVREQRKPLDVNLIPSSPRPYGSLPNSTCVFDSAGKLDCPDIRRAEANFLRQIQLVTTRMLLMFDQIAKKHNLSYWLTSGTLLGAARHKGNIPWDIDVDLEMPALDYVRFREEGSRDLPEDMFLQRQDTEPRPREASNSYINMTAVKYNPRLRDTKSCNTYCMKYNCSHHDGLMIDIYPVTIDKHGYKVKNVGFIKRLWYTLIGYNYQIKVFPLRTLQYEGVGLPVPFEWREVLLRRYGRGYMEMPPLDQIEMYAGLRPEPLHSCSELEQRRGAIKERAPPFSQLRTN